MEEISNYNGPKLIITKTIKQKTEGLVEAKPPLTQEQETEDHYNADLDLDSTDSTEVSVKTASQ